MLRSLENIVHYKVEAIDENIGHVRDFYFDDHEWVIRYVVVDTGSWLLGRDVLISPTKVGEPDWEEYVLPIAMTAGQIREAPGIAQHRPVSMQNTIDLGSDYVWAPQVHPIGMTVIYDPLLPVRTDLHPENEERKPGDPRLRSVEEVTGYHIHTSDDHKIGHVADFIGETEGWLLRYLVVDTRNWLPGKRVIISPAWIERVDWSDRLVFMELTEGELRHAPEFDPGQPINRHFETRLYDYYGRPRYWE